MLRKSLTVLLGLVAIFAVGAGILYFNKPAQYFVLLKP